MHIVQRNKTPSCNIVRFRGEPNFGLQLCCEIDCRSAAVRKASLRLVAAAGEGKLRFTSLLVFVEPPKAICDVCGERSCGTDVCHVCIV